jgi:N-acetylglucosaminyldiphosphoundecaprenol N-acetyl-beta-D-mannosaminyltransferase
MRRVAVILGAPVDDVTMDEAVERIFAFVDDGRASGRTHQVATVNVDFIVRSTSDPLLRDILQRTELSIPDGMPLVWASRLFGTPLRERVAGADLLPALAARGASRTLRLCLFGSAAGVAERAASMLQSRTPGIEVVGTEGSAVSAAGEMDPEALKPIIDAKPDIVGVALGNPKQEFWIERYSRVIGAPVCIGIGGTLDLLVGEKRRAPAWMQRSGLEWVFRAAQEPRRLVGRYARDLAVFGPRMARQAWTGRSRSRHPGSVALDTPTGRSVLTLAGTPAPQAVADVIDTSTLGDDLDVDIAALDGPDNRTAALLAAIALAARGGGTEMTLRGSSAAQLARLDDLGLGSMLSR